MKEQIITLTGENGKSYDFHIAAEIELEGYTYYVLKPISKELGLSEDEAIIFRCEADGYLEPEFDEEIIEKISVLYNQDFE